MDSVWEASDACCVSKPHFKFVLDGNSFVNMQDCQGHHDSNVYTDGSKLKDQVGSGVYIIHADGSTTELSFRISYHATVYQAELFAIKQAAEHLSTLGTLGRVKFFVDSQAALHTFQSLLIKSKLALVTIQTLNAVKHKSLTFVWTNAHVGNEGNEKADTLAKKGSTLDIIFEPLSGAKNALDHHIRSLWQEE